MTEMSRVHDDFCHLCGWWHSGIGRFDHPPLKDPLCDECYREPPPRDDSPK